MTKKIESYLSLDEESSDFYDSNYNNRYEILRNRTQIKFLDYNLLQVIRTFHIKDKAPNPTKSNIRHDLFALPEEYDIKTVLTHNLNIFLNDIEMDIMESDNEILRKLNYFNRISKTNEYINKAEKSMIELDQLAKSDLNWFFKRIYKKFKKKVIFTKFKNTLIDHLRLKYSAHLTPKDKLNLPQKQIYNTLEEGNNEVSDYIEKMLKKIKIKNHLMAEKIVRFTKSLKKLMAIPNLELIAIDLPKNFYNSSKNIKFFPYTENHFTITIKTEESYSRFTEYRNFSWIRSIFSGESIFYLIYCYIYDTSSTYFEILPSENTRIASVKRDNKREPKCNIMMETKKSKRNNKSKVGFERGFNERLVIHIPRPQKHPDFGYMFSVRYRPYKMLQWWIFISFLLSIIYVMYLSILFILLFFIESNSIYFLILLDLIDLTKFQAPWIYGLIIGNQLWLQKPKFLWKKSIVLAISIIICGIILLISCVFVSSIIYHSI